MTTSTALVVRRAFGTYSKGDLISDAATVTATLAGPYAGHVMRVSVPESAAQVAASAKVEAAEAALAAAEAAEKTA